MRRLLVGLLLAPWAGGAWADPVPMSAGAQMEPIGSESVALLEETLSIEVGFTEMRVEASLLLQAEAEAAELEVGFPCSTRPEPQMTGLGCETKLRVRVDGLPRRARLRKTEPGAGHWTWPMRFEAGRPTRVEVGYTQPMVNERYGLPLAGMGALTYRLSTGGRWAGPIRKLDMHVELPVETVAAILPPGYVRTAGQIRWSLTDFEPSGDLIILLAPMETGRYLSAFRAKDSATLRKHRKAGAFDRQSLAALAEHWTREHGPLEEQARLLWGLLPGLRETPPPTQEELRACLEQSARLIRQTLEKEPAP